MAQHQTSPPALEGHHRRSRLGLAPHGVVLTPVVIVVGRGRIGIVWLLAIRSRLVPPLLDRRTRNPPAEHRRVGPAAVPSRADLEDGNPHRY